MIDTNIVIDVLTRREPFFQVSQAVLKLSEEGKFQGFISASAATDIFYLVRKALKDTEQAYEALGHILDIAKVLTVTNEDVNQAYLIRARDFEDCLLAVCARSNHCDGIITRNSRDFLNFDIPLYSPEEALALFT